MEAWYLAHPVAGDVEGNLARAKLWLQWLTESRDDRAYIATWITECEIWDDSIPEEREAGMARNLEVLRRCDGIVLVGGQITPGMREELRHAIRWGLRIEDFTHVLGEIPPEGDEDDPSPR